MDRPSPRSHVSKERERLASQKSSTKPESIMILKNLEAKVMSTATAFHPDLVQTVKIFKKQHNLIMDRLYDYPPNI